MGVQGTSGNGLVNGDKKMPRNRIGLDYPESDVTSCSCLTNSMEKCSLRNCGMFHEPFFLHPPGSRPRDGIYINPMSAYINQELQKPKDSSESFYLHSPHDFVYTRITRLFNDVEKKLRCGGGALECRQADRKDEALTVKVDVHIDDDVTLEKPAIGNGTGTRSEINKDNSEHAYEQICVRAEETSGVNLPIHKKIVDGAFNNSRSSSSTSETSNMSSEIHCCSSSTSTPSLSRHSSNERINKSIKMNQETSHDTRTSSKILPMDIRKETGASISLSPPPPPPPPPLPIPSSSTLLSSSTSSTTTMRQNNDKDVVVVVVSAKQTTDVTTIRVEKNNEEQSNTSDQKNNRTENGGTANPAANKFDEHHRQPEVPPAASSVVEVIEDPVKTSHLVNRHMVLPFIPPSFANSATDSETLLKPSEYLKSICKLTSIQKNSLSKARSVDNLDIQSRESESEPNVNNTEEASVPGPPPPPLPPSHTTPETQMPTSSMEGSKTASQPLATISIQDLTSIQLRRTTTKMSATKAFSVPPARSVSMTNVSEPFFVQKTDLIAELKKTKDIPGIKKLKVERAQVEKTQEQNLMSEINKAFNVSNFVDQIPEKDSSGNVIPIWKRQMLARKAAERAKKELEEQIARENEERRQKAIPPWKRQLLAKKDSEEKRLKPESKSTNVLPPTLPGKIETASPVKKEIILASTSSDTKEEKIGNESGITRNDNHHDSDDDGQIIPWRAQLRKTNSKLNILD